MRHGKSALGISVIVLGLSTWSHAQSVAFPGALGFGAIASGGRNGTLYHVTTTNDSGAGSFRDAVSQPNRTVVFDVGGYITLTSEVSVKSHITIAGQTAPGGGIGISGREVSFGSQSNIICRFVRFRPGDASGSADNGLSLYRSRNVILDHVSVEFAKWNDIDGVSDDWQNHPVDNITIQNSIIANPIGQQFGAHTESVAGSWSWFYNIFANSHNRNPLAKIDTVFVNNVLYNYSAGYTTHTSTSFTHDIVNNYFIFGPATGSSPDNTWYQIDRNQSIYYSGNLKDNNKDGVLNGSLTTPYWYQGVGAILSSPWSSITPSAPVLAAELAYRHDVSAAGAFPRDEVDSLLISQVRTLGHGATGTGANTAGPDGGLYTSQTQTGLGNSGFGTLTGATRPTDNDNDGMPDFWELATGSNPNSPNALTNTADGYTLLEHYLNWLAAPHAATQSNTPVSIDLRQYTGGFATNATYIVSNAVNGTVLITDGSTARFTPLPAFFGLGSFAFYVADGGFGYSVSVSVAVTPASPPAAGVISPGATVSITLPPAPLPSNLVWRGDGASNNWNTTAANWFNGTNFVAFANGDNVIFDDSGSNTPAIKLVGAISPGAITFDTSWNFTLVGGGALSGAGPLTKVRSSALLVATTNSGYSGSLGLSGGTLSLSNGASLGTGTMTMSSGAIFTLPGSGGATFFSGAIVVPAGENVTLRSGGLGNGLSGTLSSGDSSSVLNLNGGVSFTGSSSAQFDGFTGTIFIPSGSSLRFSANSSGNIYGSLNPEFIINGTLQPRNAGNTIRLGALTGSGTITGPQSNSGTGDTTYNVGGNNSDATFAGVISSNSAVAGSLVALIKVGAGQLILTGTNTFTGLTTVSAGTLIVNGATGAGAVTVGTNATLAGSGVVGGPVTNQTGSVLSPGSAPGQAATLLIGSGLDLSGATLCFDLSSNPASGNDRIVMSGGMVTYRVPAAAFRFNLKDGTLGNGTYPLITGGSATSAPGSPALQHNLPAGTRQTISLERSAGGSGEAYARLVVSGNSAALVWAGTNTTTWDTNTVNWLGAGVPDRFYNLDSVLFDDGGSNTPAVDLTMAISPAAIRVDATKNYTFSGVGTLCGAGTLTKAGLGTLTIGTTNSAYTGKINLADGTLALTGGTSIGSGAMTMSGGATFSLPAGGGAVFFPGPITVPAGQTATIASGALGNGLSGPIASGANNSVLNLSGGVSFSGAGSSQFDGFTGTINVPPGSTLRFSANSSGNTFGSIIPDFVINGTLQPRNAGNTIKLGALAGSGTLTGPQSNSGSGNTAYAVGGDNGDATFSGVISSNTAVPGSLVALSKVGAGRLTLGGSSSYTGGTTVNAGTLRVNNTTGSGTGTGPLLVQAGATLAGSGIIAGATTLEDDATLSPGNGAGTLTFTGDLTLGESSIIQFELGTNSDQVVVGASLALAGTLMLTGITGFSVGCYTLFSYNPTSTFDFGVVTIGSAPPGFNYTLSTNTPGQVNLLVSPLSLAPPKFASIVAGGSLHLSWPADHIGWRLDAQTNALAVGLNTNWFNVPGSAATNQMWLPVDPANGSVFYRLAYP